MVDKMVAWSVDWTVGKRVAMMVELKADKMAVLMA